MTHVQNDVLEAIAYLSRSDNRVRVLTLLASEPHSSRELREAANTSKATLNRILNEFEDRSWAHRTFDGEYEATRLGEHLATQFRPFLRSVETLQALGEDVGVLPVDELTVGPDEDLTVDLHHFDGSTVERQTPAAQGVGRDHLAEAFRETSSIHVLTDMAPPRVLGEILQERAESGELSGAHVWAVDLFDHIRENPEKPPQWPDIMAAGSQLYQYDGRVPANICVVDGATLVWGAADEMRRRVVISRDDTVRWWARTVIDRYRERADSLTPDMVG